MMQEKFVNIERRYWFWQEEKMWADGCVYISRDTLWDKIRPRGNKFITVNHKPGGLTPIPSGWRIGHRKQRRYCK